jgi:hypothetical protein
MGQPLVCRAASDIDEVFAVYGGLVGGAPVQCDGDAGNLANKSWNAWNGTVATTTSVRLLSELIAFSKKHVGKPIRSPGNTRLRTCRLPPGRIG